VDVAIEAVGVLAAMLSAAFFFPQALRAVRHGTKGVSTTTFQMVVVIGTVWLLYGVVEHLPALIFGNAPVLVCAVVVLACCVRDGSRVRDVVPVALAGLAVAAIVWIVFGPSQIGWISAALGISMRVPQLRAVRASESIEGVSAITWWLGIANNAAWIIYAIPHGDYRIPIACVIQIALAASLLRAISRKRHRGALETVVDEVEHP